MGAIGEDGVRVINREVVRAARGLCGRGELAAGSRHENVPSWNARARRFRSSRPQRQRDVMTT